MTRTEYGRAYQAGFKLTVHFLASKGVPPDLAEETAQAAWTRGWERIDQLRDKCLVRTWVNSIALNMHRRSVQLNSRNQPLGDLTSKPDFEDAAIDVATLLGSCCSSDRALLRYQLDGFTASEIARELGATEIAVRIRLMRARRSARSLTEPRRPVSNAA